MTLDPTAHLAPLDCVAGDKLQVHLVGFMGCGKSTVGSLLARRLLWNFLDLDALIVRHVGRPIAEIFAQDGEDSFRLAETFVLRQAVQKPRTVVALGGGAYVADENRELSIRSAASVWLRCDFGELRRRVDAAGDRAPGARPLWGDPEEARALLARREPVYAEADWIVDSDVPPDDVAANIEALLRA